MKLLVSLSGSGLVSKPMGEGVGGEKHLGSPSLGRAGGMLSPPVPQHRGARALVAAWLFTGASRFAAGDKGHHGCLGEEEEETKEACLC